MRLLLIFAVLAGLVFAARALFFGGEAERPEARSAAVTAPAEPAQALSADQLTPSPQGSPHAIAVEEAAAPALAKTAVATPPAGTAPAPSPAERSAPPHAPGTASADNTATATAPAPAAPPDRPAFMKVTAPAPIREGPTTSAKIVGVAEAGAEAQVLGGASDWVRIVDPASKKTGWIHESFLAPQGAPQSRPVPPEEMAALAESESAADAPPPAFRQKPRRHAYRHRYWRHRLVVGPLILRFGY
jgi:cytoskeletal protein RodZ